ncbi:MAG: response regulator [Armatimonadota bacterium]|nr:response regulator [Armatimonadota bacterium]
MIVDDDVELLDTLSIVLSSMGYRVTGARSGPEGIKLMESGERYEVIITDLRMRRMDGNWFLRIAKLIDPSCKVVMMSAYATVESMVNAIREDVYDYLLKPFKIAELQEILSKVSREAKSSTLPRGNTP